MIDNVCNNFPGHGFYQFSPCLFWALLPANGFKVEFMATHRVGSSRWRTETQSSHRNEFISLFPYQLKVIAKKLESKPFTIPQQPDYVSRWSEDKEATDTQPRGGTILTNAKTAWHFLSRTRI